MIAGNAALLIACSLNSWWISMNTKSPMRAFNQAASEEEARSCSVPSVRPADGKSPSDEYLGAGFERG